MRGLKVAILINLGQLMRNIFHAINAVAYFMVEESLFAVIYCHWEQNLSLSTLYSVGGWFSQKISNKKNLFQFFTVNFLMFFLPYRP